MKEVALLFVYLAIRVVHTVSKLIYSVTIFELHRLAPLPVHAGYVLR
jgi:hypothetical protein